MNPLAWLSPSRQARLNAWSFVVGKRTWNRWVRLNMGIQHAVITSTGALSLLLTTAALVAFGFWVVFPIAGVLFDLAKQILPNRDPGLWFAVPALACLLSLGLSIQTLRWIFRGWFHWLGPHLNEEFTSAFNTSPQPTDPVFQSALPYAEALIACSRLEWALAKYFWNPQNQARLLHHRLEATLPEVATNPVKKNRL